MDILKYAADVEVVALEALREAVKTRSMRRQANTSVGKRRAQVLSLSGDSVPTSRLIKTT